jgi:Fe2+ transport system protein FeoA
MKLSELANKDTALITQINSPLDLKHRLNSFGIFKGTEVNVENISLSKNTMTIEVEHTSIALRMDEANTIEVEKK